MLLANQHLHGRQEGVVTSLLKGGYLPRPGVALAAAETISTSTRCTCYEFSNFT